MNKGVAKPVFTCIKTKAIDNIQRWVNKGSNIPRSIEKKMIWKTVIFTFCFLQFRASDRSDSTNVSHSKAKFSSWKKLEINARLYTLIYKPFSDFIRISILSTVNYNPTLANILTWERWGNKHINPTKKIFKKHESTSLFSRFYSILFNPLSTNVPIIYLMGTLVVKGLTQLLPCSVE